MNRSDFADILVLALAPWALLSCRDVPPTRGATHDSAGVTLVESPTPTWTDQSRWRLATVPRVSIGAADGPDEYQLDWIWDALRLPGRTIIVGNAGSSELRFFDSTGAYKRRAGGRGGGPGEFSGMANLYMWRIPGGLLAVSDAPVPRINLFDTLGTAVETITLHAGEGVSSLRVVGVFADGTFLIKGEEGGGGSRSNTSNSWVRFLRYSRSGEPLASIGRAPSAPRYTHSVGGITFDPYLPLTVEPAVVADSNSFLVMREGAPELHRYDLQGRLVGRISWNPDRRRVTPELYEQYVAADLAQTHNQDQRRLYESYYKLNLPLPVFVPTYQTLYVDETRHIWVERYRFPGEQARTWDILDPTGNWLGSLTLPGRFWLHRAGQDFILGTQMDSLDIERVQEYPLFRGTPR